MTTYEEKLEAFRAALEHDTRERISRQYANLNPSSYVAEVVRGRVYDKVNVGTAGNMSGRYMVEIRTETIFGIKGYGQVHKGHVYGTLDTIDQWYWGDYYAYPFDLSERKER